MDLRELRYGIEIETVKRTQEQIAWAIHSVVGGHVRHIGAPSCYDPWEVEDLRGRKWKVVNDASLTVQLIFFTKKIKMLERRKLNEI